MEMPRCDRRDDERLAERIFWGALSYERFLDVCISSCLNGSSRLHPNVQDILRMSVYQILFLDRVPESAVVNDAVQLCNRAGQKYASGMINAVLRRICLEKHDLLSQELSPALRFSHPDWLAEKMLQDHDEAFVTEFFKADQEIPALCLQVNTKKTTLEEYTALLSSREIQVLSSRTDFQSLKIAGTRVESLPGYRNGLFYVQDDAARAAVFLLNLKPGEKVLDACSAPGGKSIAAFLDGAEVISADISKTRLSRCRENYDRMQMPIPIIQQDAAEEEKSFHEAFDAVVADVPCSGSGIIRKHPEIRRKTYDEMETLLPLQQRILENLSSYVKPGGTLLYSTCSVLREEDENQVKIFLSSHPEFSLDPVLVPGFDCDGGTLRSWPHRNDNDGFFAAKLKKSDD